MTLPHGTDRLESARLVLRRVTPDDLPFYTRLHALPKVVEHLYPEGRPRSPEETKAWMEYTLASYEQWALGYLAVVRKEDGALIGRCGLMDMVVESADPEHGIRTPARGVSPSGAARAPPAKCTWSVSRGIAGCGRSQSLKFRHKEGETIMDATKGFVVPAGGGTHLDMKAPGRFAALKLFGHETNESIMMFEETVPVGTKSLFHLHHDSDEVAWVLAGEITFKIGDDVSVGGPGTCAFFPRNVPHAWKSTGTETGRVLFLYTPAAAGRYVEDLLKNPAGPMSDDERNKIRARYHWEVVGPNPL